MAEDVVPEALARALRTWPFYGVPENPPPGSQPRPIILGAGGVILKQVPTVNARRQQRVAL